MTFYEYGDPYSKPEDIAALKFADLVYVESLDRSQLLSSAQVLDQLGPSNIPNLLDLLTRELVRSFTEQVLIEIASEEDKVFRSHSAFQDWLEAKRMQGQGGRFVYTDPLRILSRFWRHQGFGDGNPFENNHPWTGSYSTWSGRATTADWQLGKFGLVGGTLAINASQVTNHGWEQPPPEALAIGQTVLFGVHFAREDIERHFGKTAEPTSVRSSEYDWPQAFADVAAEFFHNVQFHDLNARGVQTEIIGLLRQSFEDRNLKVPSDETLKTKAKMMLGALRSKEGKKP
jgi:hypothetical protein